MKSNSILALVGELTFRSKIREACQSKKIEVTFVRTPEDIEALAKTQPDMVIVDLNLTNADPFAGILKIQALWPGLEIVAYFSHVNHELEARALELKVAKVMPRSKFVGWIQSLAASVSHC